MNELDKINHKLKEKLQYDLAAPTDIKDSWGSQEDPLPGSTRELGNILTQTDMEDTTPRVFILNTDTTAASPGLQIATNSQGLVSTSQETGKDIATSVLDVDVIFQGADTTSSVPQYVRDTTHPILTDSTTPRQTTLETAMDHVQMQQGVGYSEQLSDQDDVDGIMPILSAPVPQVQTKVGHIIRNVTYDVLSKEGVEQSEHGDSVSEEEQFNDDADVIVPKALNNVSAFNFDNFVPSVPPTGRTSVNAKQGITGQFNQSIITENVSYVNGGDVEQDINTHLNKEAELLVNRTDIGSEQPHDSFFGNELPASDENEQQSGIGFLDTYTKFSDDTDSEKQRVISLNVKTAHDFYPEEVENAALMQAENNVSQVVASSSNTTSVKKLNRIAARQRREQESHKNGNYSTDSDDPQLSTQKRNRHRSKSKSSSTSGSGRNSPKRNSEKERAGGKNSPNSKTTDKRNSGLSENHLPVLNVSDNNSTIEDVEVSRIQSNLQENAEQEMKFPQTISPDLPSSQLEKVQIGSSDYDPSLDCENDGLDTNGAPGTDHELLDELEEAAKFNSRTSEQNDSGRTYTVDKGEGHNNVNNNANDLVEESDKNIEECTNSKQVQKTGERRRHIPTFKGYSYSNL